MTSDYVRHGPLSERVKNDSESVQIWCTLVATMVVHANRAIIIFAFQYAKDEMDTSCAVLLRWNYMLQCAASRHQSKSWFMADINKWANKMNDGQLCVLWPPVRLQFPDMAEIRPPPSFRNHRVSLWPYSLAISSAKLNTQETRLCPQNSWLQNRAQFRARDAVFCYLCCRRSAAVSTTTVPSQNSAYWWWVFFRTCRLQRTKTCFWEYLL